MFSKSAECGCRDDVAYAVGDSVGNTSGNKRNSDYIGDEAKGLSGRVSWAGFPRRRAIPGLVVEEDHVLSDGFPADMQFICGEFWIGIADSQAAQDRQFHRDGQLRANDLGIT